MKNILVGIAGLIVIALILIFFFHGRPSGVKVLAGCGGGPYCVEVSVDPGGGKPFIKPIDTKEVKGNGVDLTWKVVTPGYTFAANGIEFVGKTIGGTYFPPPPAGEFTCPKPDVKNDTYKCHDKHEKLGPFGYKVTLDSTPPALPVAPLDPFILND
jgi:hypothetical protein